jgi:hypothetical protein
LLSFTGKEILLPSSHEPWFLEDLIDFSLIKKQIASNGPTIVSASTSPHPEFNFFRAVCSLIKLPPPRILREWAKTVALSIQTISDENPKAPEIQSAPSSLRRHVIVLTWLNTLKNTMPILQQITDGQPEEATVTNSMATASSTSVGDALDDLRKSIIDMIMSYTIIQAHSEDQHNPRKKPKTQSKSTTVATKDAPDRKSLSEIESRHNYFPLISFFLSGVRGIFISTRDYRQYSISHCLEVLSIFKKIISSSRVPSSPHEAVWVNLGSYVRQILDSVHQSHNDVSKFIIPTRHNLAKCIAHDYINVTSKESELFNIPQNTSCQ